MSKPVPESSGYHGIEDSELDVDGRYVLQYKSRLSSISGAAGTNIISLCEDVPVVV